MNPITQSNPNEPRDVRILKSLRKNEGPFINVYSAIVTNFYRQDGKTQTPHKLTLTENTRGSYHVNLSFSLDQSWESHILSLRSKKFLDAIEEAKIAVLWQISKSEKEFKEYTPIWKNKAKEHSKEI